MTIKSLSQIGRELEQSNISPELLADFKAAQFAINCIHTTVMNTDCAFEALTRLFEHACTDSLGVMEIESLFKPHFNLLGEAANELGEVL